MRNFPDNPVDCHNHCRDIFKHGGLSDGSTCYCYICVESLTKPEFFKNAGCASYLSSVKVGHNRMLEKHYGEQYGRYYYC